MGVYALQDTNDSALGVLEDRTNNGGYHKSKDRTRPTDTPDRRAHDWDSHNPNDAQRRAAERAALRLREEKKKKDSEQRKPRAQPTANNVRSTRPPSGRSSGRTTPTPAFRKSNHDGEFRDVAEQEDSRENPTYASNINQDWKKSIFLQDDWTVTPTGKPIRGSSAPIPHSSSVEPIIGTVGSDMPYNNNVMAPHPVEPFDPLDLPSLNEDIPTSPLLTHPPLPPPYDPFSEEAPPPEGFSPTDGGYRWEHERRSTQVVVPTAPPPMSQQHIVASPGSVGVQSTTTTQPSPVGNRSVAVGNQLNNSMRSEASTSSPPGSPTYSQRQNQRSPSRSPVRSTPTANGQSGNSPHYGTTGWSSAYHEDNNSPPVRAGPPSPLRGIPPAMPQHTRHEPLTVRTQSSVNTYSSMPSYTSANQHDDEDDDDDDTSSHSDEKSRNTSPTKTHQRTVRIGGARMLSLPRPQFSKHNLSDTDSSSSPNTSSSSSNYSPVHQRGHPQRRHSTGGGDMPRPKIPTKTLDVQRTPMHTGYQQKDTPLMLTTKEEADQSRRSRQERGNGSAKVRSRSEPTSREEISAPSWHISPAKPTTIPKTKGGLIQGKKHSTSPPQVINPKRQQEAWLTSLRGDETPQPTGSSGNVSKSKVVADYEKCFAQVMRIKTPERREKKLQELHNKEEQLARIQEQSPEKAGIPKNRVIGGAKYAKVSSRVTSKPKDRTREGVIKNIYGRYQKIASKTTTPKPVDSARDSARSYTTYNSSNSRIMERPPSPTASF